MNDKIHSIENIFEKYEAWLIALPPVLITVAKYILFSMGLMYNDNIVQRVLSLLIYGVYFVLAIIQYCYFKKKTKNNKKATIFIAIIVLGILLFGYIKSDYNISLLKVIGEYLVFCVPALMIGENIAATKREFDFIEKIEKLSVFILPVACGYCLMAFTNSNPFKNSNYLGTMNYFMVGYALLPFLCCVALRFIQSDNLNFFNKTITAKKANILRIITMLIYVFDIFASGTRGAVIAVPVFLLVAILAYKVNKKRIRSIVVMLGVYLGCYLLVYSMHTPSGFYAIKRMSIFTEGLRQQQLITTTNSVLKNDIESVSQVAIEQKPEQKEEIESSMHQETSAAATTVQNDTESVSQVAIEQKPEQKEEIESSMYQETSAAATTMQNDTESVSQVAIEQKPGQKEEIESSMYQGTSAAATTVQNEYKALMEAAQKNIVQDRGELFKIAYGEFKENWILGLGPMGYYNKYRNTPHNAILELLCELGIVGAFVSSLLIYLAIKMIINIKQDFGSALFICICSAFIVTLLVSESIWNSCNFYLWLGYAVNYKKVMEDKNETGVA